MSPFMKIKKTQGTEKNVDDMRYSEPKPGLRQYIKICLKKLAYVSKKAAEKRRNNQVLMIIDLQE